MTTVTAPAHEALRWRPITAEDVPAWHRLVEAIELADDPGERYTPDDLREELLEGSWKDPARDSILGVDADGEARAFGQVEVLPGDVRTVRAFCWGGVHPQWRERGIGRALLAWQEELGRAKIAAADREGAPGRLLVSAEDRMVSVCRLLDRAGFREMRYFVELSRPLDEQVAPAPLRDGLRLVPFDPALSEQVRLAHNEAFAGHWGSEPRTKESWDRGVTGSRRFRAAWSFVVLDGEEVAGYSLTSAYEQDWEAQGYTSGWTDVLGVRSAWRRQGVASALLAATMAALRADGIERADLDVDTDNSSRALDLYTALGYRPTRRTVTYGKDV
ncbi:GNAT family N-acetyltransferase [Georgenia sunbinii]|uniref:GNAT family N-acetyltransferase n=1 Tax=Georgenia sunbinii TaxID=3117728 RepID=UPI002F26581B